MTMHLWQHNSNEGGTQYGDGDDDSVIESGGNASGLSEGAQ